MSEDDSKQHLINSLINQMRDFFEEKFEEMKEEMKEMKASNEQLKEEMKAKVLVLENQNRILTKRISSILINEVSVIDTESLDLFKDIEKANLQTQLENASRNQDSTDTIKSNTKRQANGQGHINSFKFVKDLSYLKNPAFQQEDGEDTTRATGIVLTLSGEITCYIDTNQENYSFSENKDIYVTFNKPCNVPQSIYKEWEYQRGVWRNVPNNKNNDEQNFLQLILTDDTGINQFKIIVKNYGLYDADISCSEDPEFSKDNRIEKQTSKIIITQEGKKRKKEKKR